jgi:peroxiredoxin
VPPTTTLRPAVITFRSSQSRLRRPPRPLAGAVLTMLMFLAAACGGSDDVMRLGSGTPEPDPSSAAVTVGELVDRPFTTFDGRTANFADYRGRPLVINFFARSCTACVAEMPDFQAVFEALDDTVAFVGISNDPRRSDAETLVEQTGVTYDLGWDPQASLVAAFGGYAMPTTVLVDADGIIRTVRSSALSRTSLRSMIDELLVSPEAVDS